MGLAIGVVTGSLVSSARAPQPQSRSNTERGLRVTCGLANPTVRCGEKLQVAIRFENLSGRPVTILGSPEVLYEMLHVRRSALASLYSRADAIGREVEEKMLLPVRREYITLAPSAQLEVLVNLETEPVPGRYYITFAYADPTRGKYWWFDRKAPRTKCWVTRDISEEGLRPWSGTLQCGPLIAEARLRIKRGV